MDVIPQHWRAGRAAGAVIAVEGRGYLLQLRDRYEGIWYPGYWGLFGGTAKRGESAETALRRELAEELSLADAEMRYFMSMSFDFASASARRIRRDLFEVRLPPRAIGRLRLGEGRAMRCWRARDIPRLRLIPADRAVLDFHASQDRWA